MAKEKEGKLIGEIDNYFQHVKAAAIKLTAPLSVGDKIRIVGGEKNIEMTIESIQIDKKPIEKAKKGDEVGFLVPEDVRKGYRVYKL
jgi:putative protease